MLYLKKDEHETLMASLQRFCSLSRVKDNKDPTETFRLTTKEGSVIFEASTPAMNNLLELLSMSMVKPDIDSHALRLTRRSLKIMQSLALSQIFILTNQSIPTYEEKIKKDPKTKEHYQKYLLTCKSKLVQLQEIEDKILKELRSV